MTDFESAQRHTLPTKTPLSLPVWVSLLEERNPQPWFAGWAKIVRTSLSYHSCPCTTAWAPRYSISASSANHRGSSCQAGGSVRRNPIQKPAQPQTVPAEMREASEMRAHMSHGRTFWPHLTSPGKCFLKRGLSAWSRTQASLEISGTITKSNDYGPMSGQVYASI